MINQLFNFHHTRKFILACSGGVDSIAIADFYKNGKKNFALAYFNHGTKQANSMQDFVSEFANRNKIDFCCGKITREKLSEESWEEYWRNERYAFLNSFKLPIITAHHLDDVIEQWIFSALNGNPRLILPRNGLVFRPFLTTPKAELINWAKNRNLQWLEDNSNYDTKFPRNRIRHNIIPECLMVNPGLSKVVKKKVLADFEENKKHYANE